MLYNYDGHLVRAAVKRTIYKIGSSNFYIAIFLKVYFVHNNIYLTVRVFIKLTEFLVESIQWGAFLIRW